MLGSFGGSVVGRAVVEMIGDSSQLRSDFAKSEAEVDARTGGMATKATRNMAMVKTAALAAAPVVAAAIAKIAADSIEASANLIEMQNKVNQVFESAATPVREFAESAEDIGLAESAALDAAGAFGAMFDSAGIAEKQAAEMSVTMSQLGADMGSFSNQDPSEMLQRLRGGLAGEAEPLRRFGVFISEAATKAQAYKDGIAEVGTELTDAQKVQARYNLILDQTAKQQGDFQRTIGTSLPNQIRVARAEIENLEASLGEGLLPVLTDTLAMFNDTADVVGHLPLERIGPALGAIFRQLPGAREIAAFGNVSDAMGEVGQAIGISAEAAQVGANEQTKLADAHREAASAARDQASAELALAGGFLGIQGAALGARNANRTLADAQAEVNKLARNGKKGSEEYKDALLSRKEAELGAIQSQLGLAQAVAKYIDEQKEGKVSQREVAELVRDYGEKANLTDGQIDNLIGTVRGLIGEYNRVPASKKTNVDANVSQAVRAIDFIIRKYGEIPDTVTTVHRTVVTSSGHQPLADGGVIAGAQGFITKGPTFLVGESSRQTFAGRGTEAVIPFDDRGIGLLSQALERAMGRNGGGRGGMTLVLDFGGERITRHISRLQEHNRVTLEGLDR